MSSQLLPPLAAFGVTPVELAMLGSALGALLIVFGVASAFRRKDPVLRRLEASGPKRQRTVESGLLLPSAPDPRGLDRVLIPSDRAERTHVQRQLSYAGLNGPHALRNYYLVRIMLSIILPLLFLGLIFLLRSGGLWVPTPIARRLGAMSHVTMIQITALLVGVGFFFPALWLRDRANQRRDAIEKAFPNALDLLQVSVEAGLGLDAAIIRVANEIAEVAPEISEEFLTAQREVQAGRGRDKALFDMAERTQVEEVKAFVNVVIQASRYGTNITDVLMTYAQEMRQNRELKAQEMANKLPVKISAVMASLMLPALLIMTVGPIALRYMRVFGG
ncbi:type II secretion system F family protein [Solirhodobacter olei]|uniref:type II secretion system F family protein n=1 Tax=Solirhodobacter olei TaxID=2493082 RepID=UPI000FDC4FB0|nr:type II secretion system F family protein [Solirhodobacter olei]